MLTLLKAISIASLLSLSSLSSNSVAPVQQNEQPAEIKACEYTVAPIPEIGEAILIEDNSTVSSFRSSNILVDVNRVYSIRIQDPGGSCVSSATVRVSGHYTYSASSKKVISSSLNATMASIPANWTVSITGTSANTSGAGLTYTVRYRSYVNDPYSCLVGGGYWYSAATLTIK